MKTILFTLIVLTHFSVFAESLSGVKIEVKKSKSDEWTLSYKTNKPAKQLSFVRNPDNSRTERWKTTSNEFEVMSKNGNEHIVRKDDAEFSEVELTLTPTYKSLTKDYAPFSPYSNGGALIYTGRLFACINECSDSVNGWNISMVAPEGEHLIVNGKVYKHSTSWLGKDDGSNVYIGKQTPIEDDNVITVIDSGLPQAIQTSLNNDIPKLMRYFEKRLGKLTGTKPTLFASYANIKGTSSQGGTLPNQIFMHWNNNTLSERVKDNKFLNDTIWFFAHEVAHLYQRSSESQLYGEASESWLHEGNADYLASLVLLELYPKTENYVTSKISWFSRHCAKGLNKIPLVQAAEKGQFGLYYTCGLLIHRAIDNVMYEKTSGSKNIYSLWNEFREQVEQGGVLGAETFLNLVQSYSSKELVEHINTLVNAQLRASEKALMKLNPDLTLTTNNDS